MKPITRIRIVLFALMIFGSFANFALNEWGNTLIIWCEVLMATSFLGEMAITLFHSRKNKNRKKLNVALLAVCAIMIILFVIIINRFMIPSTNQETFDILVPYIFLIFIILMTIDALYDFFKKIESRLLYENFFLCIIFLALIFRNLSYPGTGVMLVFSVLFLVPYFITTTIKFFKVNYKFGKPLIVILTFGSFATVFLGITYMMKTMHWPFADTFFYLASVITLVMIVGALKWTYVFNGEKINILQGLRLFKTNVILLFFMLFVFTSYKYFNILKLAPDFYSADYPEIVYQLRTGTSAEWFKASEIKEAYDNFIQKAAENGFIK
jgi:hypothetical protein